MRYLTLLPLLPLLHAAESRYANLDGLKVHYENHGQGRKAVLFIHGWTCDLTFWRLQTPAVAARHRVVLVDLPGHGLSDKPENVSYSLPLFARAVGAVLRDAGVEQAVLVGHSMGVPVSRQVIRMYGEKIAGFVAVDGFFRRTPSSPEELEKATAQWNEFVKRYRGPDYKDQAARAIDSMFGPATSDAVRQEIKSKMLSAPRHVMFSAMEGMGDWTYNAPDRIAVPTLAIFAKRPALTADAEQYARTFIPNLDWQVWEGVNHFLMMEKPEEFNRVLLEFLAAKTAP
ncbi:MAG: alpha/beta hydrolase [Candidatus Solibacter usitatus]|nr:alpha/beta hydrolase [Candidatus Solibacter usitatus]